MRRACLLVALALVACGPLSPLSGSDGGTDGGLGGGLGGGGGGGGVGGGAGGGGAVDDAGTTDAGTNTPDGGVEVTTLYTGRSRLGARSTAGFRPWRGGLAVIGSELFWVESGSAPGLYRAPLAGCTAGTCVTRMATVTRPSVFATTGESVLVADVTTLRRYAPDGGVQSIASGSTELLTLGTDGAAAFWTTEDGAVNKTPFGGVTSTPIYSNGTPWAMTVAGQRVYWVGVDISGLQAALQSMRTDGTGAREESRSGNGFETLGGNGSYLYYAKDSPARVLRLTLSNGFLEEVATNAQGVKAFALDDTYAWWVEPGSGPDYANGRVRRIAHDSTTAQTVAVSVKLPVAIAVSGGVAYVASAGTPSLGYADGAILRIAPR